MQSIFSSSHPNQPVPPPASRVDAGDHVQNPVRTDTTRTLHSYQGVQQQHVPGAQDATTNSAATAAAASPQDPNDDMSIDENMAKLLTEHLLEKGFPLEESSDDVASVDLISLVSSKGDQPVHPARDKDNPVRPRGSAQGALPATPVIETRDQAAIDGGMQLAGDHRKVASARQTSSVPHQVSPAARSANDGNATAGGKKRSIQSKNVTTASELVTVFDDESSSTPAGSPSIDVSSLGSSFMKMSTDSGGSSKPSTISSLSSSSKRTKGSGAGSKKKAGLETVVENVAQNPEGIEVDVGVVLETDARRKKRGTKDDDSMSLLSSFGGSVSSIFSKKGAARNVDNTLLRDKEGRIGLYTGQCCRIGRLRQARNFPDGHGSMAYSDDGLTYDGEWYEGVWEGYGKIEFAKNDYYAGDFKNGLFEGHGVRAWNDGSSYEGWWEGGKRSGQGTLKRPDGNVFDGTWENDSMEGEGRRTLVDIDEYVGQFVGGVQQGACKYRDRYGREHEGHWVTNHDLGDGSRYSGLWKHGRKDSFGTCWYENGDFYEGKPCCCVKPSTNMLANQAVPM